MTTATAHYTGVDQRASPRTDVYARIPTSLADGRSPMTTLVNISADGVLLRHSDSVKEGDLVHVALPVIGRTPGIVVWSIGGRTGVNFLSTIPQADYLPLLRALGVNPG